MRKSKTSGKVPGASLIGRINSDIDSSFQRIRDFHVQMLRINAVNSKMGGPGEEERADFLQAFLEGDGFKVERVEAPGENGGKPHPNLFAKIPGQDESKTLWIVSHMDTVPEGSRELWENDPFDPVIRDGKIFARGASDNGQSLVASIFALKEIKDLGVPLSCNFGVSLVADEEFDSKAGVYYLLDRNKFRKSDLVIVEGGSYGGRQISIAEKHLLWIKLITHGKQVHASNPSKGVNAHKIGMRMGLDLDLKLHQKYNRSDPFFDKEHRSTFVITKKDANVGNINTIPGIDSIYMDFRVLPSYSMDSIIGFLRSQLRIFERQNKTKIDLQIVERQDAGPATTPDAEVVQLMQRAIPQTTKNPTKLVGLSGQTVGNIFREYGYPCVGWGYSELESTAHQPNEYCALANLLMEAKAFSSLPLCF